MSYEGYDEYLCAAGHYGAFDVYQDTPKMCRCGAAWAWVHSVDQTNGYDETDPVCCDAPKMEIGGDPVPHTDYLGNEYFTCNARYAPVGEAWEPLAQAMSAGTAKTEGLGGDSPASAVGETDAPNTTPETSQVQP